MTDLADRFKTLDVLTPPDLWREIESRAVVPQPRPDRTRLVLLVATAAVVIAAVGGAAALGSGVVQLPVIPLPGDDRATPGPAPNQDAAPPWTLVGDMIEPRGGHTATLLPDGTVLVAGGNSGADDAALATAERYDPVARAWTAAGDMTEPRSGHSATLLPDGTVLVVGGFDGTTATATAERYDPGTGTWTAVASLSHPRGGHVAVLLGDGTVLVVGGGDGSPVPGAPPEASTTLATAERYDYRADSWGSAGRMTEPRWNHTATLLPDGTVLVAGGSVWSNGRWLGLDSAETFDPDTDAWDPTADMHHPRGDGHSATLLPDGTVLVLGFGPSERYDPASRSWMAVESPRPPRGPGTATLLPDGSVLIAGGAIVPADDSFTDRVERYDPGSGTWTQKSPLNLARKGHTATLLLDGTVLVAGGSESVTNIEWVQTSSAEVYVPRGSD